MDRNLSQMEPWSYQTFKICQASALLLGKGPQRAFLTMPSEQAILIQWGGFDFCEGPEEPCCSGAWGWKSLKEEPVMGGPTAGPGAI